MDKKKELKNIGTIVWYSKPINDPNFIYTATR
jgi:hypothetical protein